MNRQTPALVALLLAACAAPPVVPEIDIAVAVLLLGEQHDAPAHQQIHHETVTRLAGRGQLAALALEMAEQGSSTAGLPAGASEDQVRKALTWNEKAWPWERYAPAVMTAVRASVPVLGANLPRERMRPAMADASLDALLAPAGLAAQQDAVREGHCGLLPATQLLPMARIQLARDRAMAQTVAAAVVPGKVVVLVAGARHVDGQVGVPAHLPPGLRVKTEPLPAPPPARDYCADLRRQLRPGLDGGSSPP